jgi:hypothetical protein
LNSTSNVDCKPAVLDLQTEVQRETWTTTSGHRCPSRGIGHGCSFRRPCATDRKSAASASLHQHFGSRTSTPKTSLGTCCLLPRLPHFVTWSQCHAEPVEPMWASRQPTLATMKTEGISIATSNTVAEGASFRLLDHLCRASTSKLPLLSRLRFCWAESSGILPPCRTRP